MQNMNSVLTRLDEHAAAVTEQGLDFFFVALQGSQNYGLEYEKSDVDSKALIFPSFRSLVLNEKKISTTHILENDEHVDLKDIRLMFDCFWKQNINFLEILFTKYVIVNPKYLNEFIELKNLRERIAHYNNYAAVKCIYGMATEKMAALDKPYPSQKEVVEKYGYSGKQLHHILRLLNFMEAYSRGRSYAECLTSCTIISKDMLMAAKRQEFSLTVAKALAESAMLIMENSRENYMRRCPLKVDEEARERVNEFLYELLKKKFREEII